MAYIVIEHEADDSGPLDPDVCVIDTAAQESAARSALRDRGIDHADIYVGDPGDPDSYRSGGVLFAAPLFAEWERELRECGREIAEDWIDAGLSPEQTTLEIVGADADYAEECAARIGVTLGYGYSSPPSAGWRAIWAGVHDVLDAVSS
jgi:hypothetical protein